MFLLALIMVIPFFNLRLFGGIDITSLTIFVLTLPVLSGISRLIVYRNMKRAYYPLALACIGLAGVGVFYAVDPSLLSSMLGSFNVFTPEVTTRTVLEAQPLLFPGGDFTLKLAWYYFTTGVITAPVALGMMIYSQIKAWSPEKTFLIIWCLIMLAAMLGQERFAYYFAVNVALLTGYLCWRIPEWSRSYFRKWLPERKKIKGKISKKKKKTARPIRGYLNSRCIWAVLWAITVFFSAFFPNIVEAMNVARYSLGPNEAWYSSLIWMRENTPDPFEDLEDTYFYYELYKKPPSGESYEYPESAYGVMNWWDYGHWITHIAHRIPNANPFQAGVLVTTRFFTAENESSANDVLDELGSKYVIVDYEMVTTKFRTITIWTEESESNFAEVYYQETTGGGLKPKLLYYPNYYQTMCVRLYNFGGEEIVPQDSTWVISYAEMVDNQGIAYKVITSVANDGEPFPTYEEALEFVESQTDPYYRIVGTDRFISPIPLEELQHYRMIYQSEPESVMDSEEQKSLVKIFEYTP